MKRPRLKFVLLIGVLGFAALGCDEQTVAQLAVQLDYELLESMATFQDSGSCVSGFCISRPAGIGEPLGFSEAAFGLGATKSLACLRATDSLAADCTNEKCAGCLAKLDCDCACLFGDLVCACSIQGMPCPLELEDAEPRLVPPQSLEPPDLDPLIDPRFPS